MLVNKETLIGKYLSGNTTPEETKKLTDWLSQNPSNQMEFNRIEKLWENSLRLKKDSDADVEKAWNEFKTLTKIQPEIRVRKMNFGWLKVAASLALFIVTGVVVKLFFTSPSAVTPSKSISVAVKPAPEPIAVSTPDMSPLNLDSIEEPQLPSKPTSKRTKKSAFSFNSAIAMITITAGDSAQIFQLPDNSIVYLNANSKLEYPQNFNKTNRRVSLLGEAYFDVKKDSGQFVVACENTIIRGKGTTFNVKSRTPDKEVEVIVASGSVEFSGIGYKDFKKLTLTTGESGYYNKTKSAISKSKHHRKNYKWWEKKSLRSKIKDFFDRLLGKKH